MDPLTELGLSPSASLEDVRARWRELAAVHHPDKGGNITTFQHLKLAYEEALAFVSLPIICPVCKGSKIQPLQRSFGPRPCVNCGGEGRVTPK